jgi:uncharacterized DUF497 family protein
VWEGWKGGEWSLRKALHQQTAINENSFVKVMTRANIITVWEIFIIIMMAVRVITVRKAVKASSRKYAVR